MFKDFDWFIILYTIQDGKNNLEQMVGFVEPPTIQETKSVLDNAINDSLIQTDQPVYMCQMQSEQAKLVFIGL